MHDAAFAYVQRFATDAPAAVIEVGSRNVNSTIRPLFPNADYWGIDAQPGDCVDEVADGATWQPAHPVDLVVCAEVFEHTPDWPAIVANCFTMLRPGGRVVLTCAGPGRPEHGVNIDDPLNPGHYANVTTVELAAVMSAAGFVHIVTDSHGDDTRATGLAPPVDTIITTLLTAVPDPQRGVHFASDVGLLADLIASTAGHRLVVLHDCLDESDTPSVQFIRVDPGGNPYFHRWAVIADHLAAGTCDRVWCVDGTDVELLHDPFPNMQLGVLYVGSEPLTVGFAWMRVHHPSVRPWMEANPDLVMLNPGIVGGSADDVAAVAEKLAAWWPSPDLTDMGAFNQIMYADWPDHVTGPQVHTLYRSFSRNDHSWFRHK